jgi:hypothetical protein
MNGFLIRLASCAAIAALSALQSHGSIVTYAGEDEPGSIRNVISSASDGDVVTFADSIDSISVLYRQIVIEHNITIDGSALSARPKILGSITNADDGCLFKIAPGATVNFIGLQFDSYARAAANFGDLTVSNCLFTSHAGMQNQASGTLTLVNSRFEGTQDGLINFGGSLQVSNCVFTQLGGPFTIQSQGGFLTVEDSSVSNNLNGSISQMDGVLMVARTTVLSNSVGGISIGGGTAEINTTTIHGNGTQISNAGAALYNNGELTVRFSAITGNHGDPAGGLANGGTIFIQDSLISENLGAHGGGIYNSGRLTANNVVVSLNTAAIQGGGIANEYGVVELQNSQIDQNSRGGIYNAAELVARSCTISSNQGGVVWGGGISQAAGSLSLLQCTLQGNGAVQGGAIYKSGGNLILTGCNVLTNLASNYGGFDPSIGGGIYNTGGDLVLSNSTFSANSPGAYNIFLPGFPPRMIFQAGFGGGVAVSAGRVAVYGCTFSFNSGSAIYLNPASSAVATTILVQNSTIVSNTAAGQGGAGIFSAGDLQIEHSTIVSNNALVSSATGGGIYATKSFSLINSIVARNQASSSPDISGTFTGSNNLVGVDPQLSPLGDFGGPTFTMVPLSTSPARDAGTATTLRYDQRGLPRVAGSAPDIGAVEIDFSNLAAEGAFLRATPMASGAIEIRFPNAPGNLSASEDLALWTLLGPGIETPPGSHIFRFEDKEAPAHPRRFYRVRY